MVGKIVKSSAPFQCANYCLNHDNAEVLYWDGLDIDILDAERLADSSGIEREALAREMAHAIDTSFALQAQTNAAVEKPVGHIPLCFMKEDAPLLDNDKMVQIAREYMEMMGYQNTQYMFVRHHNAKGNPHVHIFFNRVGNDGRCLNAWQDYKRNALACRELTEKYGLHLSDGRRNTVVQDLHGRERARYQISNAIDAALPLCRNVAEFGRMLLRQGITTEMHRRGGTGEVYGISFAKSDDRHPGTVYTFRGSEVGRKYSYRHIMDALGKARSEKEEKDVHSEVEHAHEKRHDRVIHIPADIFTTGLSPASVGHSMERDIDADPRKRKRKKGMHM